MRLLIAAAAIAAAAVTASAQAPVVNAVVERRAPSRDLAREIQSIADQGRAAWIGYRVPIFRRADAALRSSSTCCGRCRLEPATDLVVLVRVEAKAVVELRPMSVDCDVDAAGMPLVWLDPVNADDSVAWLASLVDGNRTPAGQRMSNNALVAIAEHASAAAPPVLVGFARTGETKLRSQALIWLAQRAASQALPAINDALQDPELEIKKRAAVALSQFPNGEGLPRLMEVARSHPNVEVRRQAMNMLGQSKDPRAVDFFAQILLK